MAGAPKIDVDYESLVRLLECGTKKSAIANQLNLNRTTLDKIIADYDLQDLTKWSLISDNDIDGMTREAMTTLPGFGERMLIGFFKAKGHKVQRRRLRESIRRVDPIGLAERRTMLHYRTRRRVYSVPHPHFMWHIDGNHKLIRWGLVIHVGIDGHSRSCLYLKCSNNNKSETVFELFKHAIRLFNVVPKKVRSDYGTENVRVWESMTTETQTETGPTVLVGSSVHNQRVERFNREINRNIRDKYAAMFYSLENSGLLNIDNVYDIFALHYVFIPRINVALAMLANSHNNHGISTEHNQTPNQIIASHGYDTVTHEHTDNVADMLRSDDDSDDVLSDYDWGHLVRNVPSLTSDETEGCTVYEAVREYVHDHGGD